MNAPVIASDHREINAIRAVEQRAEDMRRRIADLFQQLIVARAARDSAQAAHDAVFEADDQTAYMLAQETYYFASRQVREMETELLALTTELRAFCDRESNRMLSSALFRLTIARQTGDVAGAAHWSGLVRDLRESSGVR